MTVSTTTTVSRTTPTPAERQKPKVRFRGFDDPEYYKDPRNGSISNFVRFGPNKEWLSRADFENREVMSQARALGPDVAAAMQEVLSGSPTVSPGVAAALALMGAGIGSSERVPGDIRDRILALDATASGLDPERPDIDRRPAPGSQAEKSTGLMRIVKAIARPAFAALSMPQEALMGAIRGSYAALAEEGGPDWEQFAWQLGGVLPPISLLGEANDQYERPNPYEQTLGGQMILDIADTNERAREVLNITQEPTAGVDLGDGFFVGGRVASRQAQEARAAAPLVHGRAWTIGRGFGSLVYDDPERTAYKTLSGLIDFMAVIALDPLVLGGKAAAVGRGARAGARSAALTSTRTAAEEATLARETARLVDDVGTYVEDVVRLQEDTLTAARGVVATQQGLAGEAHRVAGAAVDPTQRAETLARRDELLDARDLAMRDLEDAKRRVVQAGGTIDASGRPRVGAAGKPEPRLAEAVDRVTMAIGDEALDALQARVLRLQPDLPGQFTDAAFSATKRRTDEPNLLPGTADGRDGLVLWKRDTAPVLVSVDDPVENVDAVLGAFRSAAGSRSNQRKTFIRQMTDLLTTPGTTWGDVIEASLQRGMGTVLYKALLDSDIDGVSDVFRLKGGENGVWWTTREAEGLPMGRQGWERAVDLRKDATERLRLVREQLTAVRGDLRDLDRADSAYRRAANVQADSVARAVDRVTSLEDEGTALRHVLEFGFGASRVPGRVEGINYEVLQAALFGNTNRLDDLLGVTQDIGTRTRTGEAFGRATLALGTLGVSEAGRALRGGVRRSVIEPTRKRALQAMVTAGPDDLGLLQRLTRGKIDNETLRAVSRAQTEDEILEILVPHLGLRVGTPLTGNPLGAGRFAMQRVSGHTPNVLWARALDWLTKQTSVMPRPGTFLNYTDEVGSTQVLRSYLTAAGMAVPKVDSVLNRYIAAETEPGRARAAMDAFRSLATDLSEKYNTRLSPETREMMDDALRKATSVYEGGSAEVNNWWRSKYATDANLGYLTADGKRIELPGPQLEAELARGGAILPDPIELRAAYGRWGAALQKNLLGVGTARTYAEKGMDLWRSAMLVRLAYVWRNIGEMQIRMQLAGHQTVFSNPLNFFALGFAMNPRSGGMRRLAGGFARYNRTAFGGKFEVPRGGDIDDFDAALDDFANVMTRDGSFHDVRSYRSAMGTGAVRPVRVDQPEFTAGWANELLMLHASRLARIVAGENPEYVAQAMARGMAREDAVMYWLRNHPGAARVRQELFEAGDAFRQILADPTALRQYLFEGQASIAQRIKETTGGIDSLRDFIHTGRLAGEDGSTLFAYRVRGGTPAEKQEFLARRTQTFGAALTKARLKQRLPDDYKVVMRSVVPGKEIAPQRLASRFFSWSGRLERAHAVGPEFAYSYWDTVADLMPAMTIEARRQVFGEARRQAGLLGRGNVNLVKARKAMKAESGTLTVDDVHRAASARASEVVGDLFYDAAKRQEFWHATRLALPFAQATYNTFTTWGRLMATKPVEAYKVGRALHALQERDSNVLYDIFDQVDPTDSPYDFDPKQGFLYRDPDSNELEFRFPLAGSALGSVLAPLVGANLPEAQSLTATASSLNLALQGKIDFLPGAGPIVALPAAAIMPDDWYGFIPETMRDWLFPFGEPMTDAGILESQMPAWMRRMIGALGPGHYGDQFRAYAYKGAMAYVASTQDFPDLLGNPQAQAAYLEEVDKVARAMTFIRAVGTFVLPAAPLQDIYAKDTNGELISVTLLGSYWRQIQDRYPNDFERQVSAFYEMFGEQAIYAILPSTKGERSVSGPGWEFQKAHSGEARAHSKVLGAFFPGDFSQEAAAWQRQTGRRAQLSPEEREDEALRYIYKAREASIERMAALYEWDTDTLDEAKQRLVEEEFGGIQPPYAGSEAATLDDVRRALRTAPNLARTRGGEGASLLFEAFDEYTAISQERYGSGLSGKKATPLREQFLEEVNQIASQYALVQGRENEGAVDLIAAMFVRAVQPRS